MWITRENGKRLNVRRADFEALQEATRQQKPKEIARTTLRMVGNSKMANRELTEQMLEGIKKIK